MGVGFVRELYRVLREVCLEGFGGGVVCIFGGVFWVFGRLFFWN